MIERVPPQNIEAEQAVLGAMLIKKEAIAEVSQLLKPADFYREAHRIVYETMLELFNKNEAVDLITLVNALGRGNPDVDTAAMGDIVWPDGLSWFATAEDVCQAQTALELFNPLVARNPNGPAFYGRAMAYQLLGQRDASLRDIDQAIRLEPRNPLYASMRASIAGSSK